MDIESFNHSKGDMAAPLERHDDHEEDLARPKYRESSNSFMAMVDGMVYTNVTNLRRTEYHGSTRTDRL